jgi:hypothetical protein
MANSNGRRRDSNGDDDSDSYPKRLNAVTE